MKDLRDAVLITFANVLNMFVQWLILTIITRKSGFLVAGDFSLAISITAIFFCFSHYGLRSFQISDIKNQYSDYDYISTRYITCGIGLLLCVLYCFIMGYSHYQIILVSIYMIFITIAAYTDVFHGILQKHEKLVYTSISVIIRSIAIFIGFFLVYSFTKSLLLSTAGMVLSSFLVLILFDLVLVSKYVSIKRSLSAFDFSKIKELLISGFFIVLLMISGPIFVNIPRLVLESSFSSVELGIFYSISVPATLVSSVAFPMLTPFTQRLAFFFASENKNRFIRLFLIVIASIVLFGLFCYLFALLFGEFFLVLIYGEGIRDYAYILNILVISMAISVVNGMLYNLYIVFRRLKRLVALLGIVCLFCYVFSIVLIPLKGMNGAAYVFVLVQLLQATILSFDIKIIIRKVFANKITEKI